MVLIRYYCLRFILVNNTYERPSGGGALGGFSILTKVAYFPEMGVPLADNEGAVGLDHSEEVFERLLGNPRVIVA